MIKEKNLTGLSLKQVELSRARNGENVISNRRRRGFFSRLAENFGDPIIKILLIALALNILFIFRGADWYESAGIALAVFLATFVSTLSEYGSESAFDKLQEDASRVECSVIRAGKTLRIPKNDIVVGDLVIISAGEKIPADGFLIRGKLSVDQSALNGESREAEKRPGTAFENEILSGCSLFCGSIADSGRGIMEVVHVGDRTVFGEMAAELGEETRQSPLKLRLAHLAKTLSRIGYAAAGAVAFADLFHQIFIDSGGSLSAAAAVITTPSVIVPHLLHAATLAITVIVVAVPEGLPMMITVVLSSNMKRMLSDKVLVRKLVGIETSGSLNILFTDKTGTLTQGKMEVSEVILGSGTELSNDQAVELPVWERIFACCKSVSAAVIADGRAVDGNPTDRAVLNFALRGKTKMSAAAKLSVTDRIEFDSEKKYSAANVNGVWRIMGAGEIIMRKCEKYIDRFGNLNALSVSAISRAIERKASAGGRIIALAECANDPRGGSRGMTLLCLLVLSDRPRPGVRDAVNQMRQAGVRTVMVTGDNPLTAEAIARDTGIISTKEDVVLSSSELAGMSDDAVKELMPRLSVVARAKPTDKSRLVRLAEDSGLVAGMTGDGINDAPALKKADVGFVMGSGTEIAKEAGDIVILDDNYSSIAKAVLYGRTIFKSIRKFIVFQLTMNFCAVGVSVIAPFIGVESPVTVIQMLWINIIMDTLAGLAFAGEPPLREYMVEPPKKRGEPIINRYMYSQIISMAVFTVAVCIGFLTLPLFFDIMQTFGQLYFMTMFFTLFVFAGVFNGFNARTHRVNLLAHIGRNPAFITVMGATLIVQIGLIFYGGMLFRTAPLLLNHIGLCAALALCVIPADLVRKCVMRALGRRGGM